MEERDAAMRGRSCWTRRLVLQQRRSGCCRLDATWFLAWAKGAIEFCAQKGYDCLLVVSDTLVERAVLGTV